MPVHFHSKNWLFDASASSSPDASSSYDGLFETSYSDISSFQVLYDLGQARNADRFWSASDGMSLVGLEHGASAASLTNISSLITEEHFGTQTKYGLSLTGGLYSWTQQSSQFWRLTFSGAGSITVYQSSLMENYLTLTDGANMPARILRSIMDEQGGLQRLADGSAYTWNGPLEGGAPRTELFFERTPKAVKDALEELWREDLSTGRERRPEMSLMPEPDDYPADMDWVGWPEQEFSLQYHAAYTGEGFTGTIVLVHINGGVKL